MPLLSRWFDIRPGEARPLVISFLGSFCVVSFLILGRALREAYYLARFDVTTLPLITGAVALLGLPVVAAFSALLAKYPPRHVVRALAAVLAVGLSVLWLMGPDSAAAVVAFYLWTAVGTLMLASGFWVVTAELFPLRSAKRLFGLISGGGTAGAMVMGASLSWLTRYVDVSSMGVGLIGLLLILILLQSRIAPPRRGGARTEPETESRPRLGEGLSLVFRSPHLRLIALVVGLATMATTLLDYQFKELVSSQISSAEQLASFFGAFYGFAGLLALMIQVLASSRLLARWGVGVSLSVLPAALVVGSFGLVLAPTLVLATAVRGADYSLRKSLHRTVLEYLYLPLPSLLRRKTKTFIDTVVDSSAEGVGAVIVYLWVTLAGLPSRFLAVAVGLLGIALITAARAMSRQYLQTLAERLRADEGPAASGDAVARFDGKNLLTVTLTSYDIQGELARSGVHRTAGPVGNEVAGPVDDEGAAPAGSDDLLDLIQSPDNEAVARVLEENDSWRIDHVPSLIRLLARTPVFAGAARALQSIGDDAIEMLITVLDDEDADFVIRRRAPRILADVANERADEALVRALRAHRFEVRYRAAGHRPGPAP